MGGVRGGSKGVWSPHLESGGYVKREYVTIERKDVQMVLVDVELDWASAAVLQPQILQADWEFGV